MVASALKEGKLETVLDKYTLVTTGLYVVYPYSKFVSTKVRAFVDFIAKLWSN
jgi:DNA-binding transcriptional LysR family regulator